MTTELENRITALERKDREKDQEINELKKIVDIDMQFIDGRNIQTGRISGSQVATDTDQKVAFHGSTPVAQETVTGSRGANAALADLLTKLANKGIIVDSTT